MHQRKTFVSMLAYLMMVRIQNRPEAVCRVESIFCVGKSLHHLGEPNR
jgi:hypothetical protein